MRVSRLLWLASVVSLAAPSTALGQRCVAAGDMADNAAQDRWCGTSLITTRLDGSPLGGTAGFGSNTSCMAQNDDGSSPPILLNTSSAFPAGLRFFTPTPHTTVYVNTNGNITFSNPLSQFTPDPFPVAPAANRPMIAPFWADVDIRGADGSCTESVGTTCTSCAPCQPYASNQVWWNFEPGRAIFTWDEVGYYNCQNDRRQSFQLVLTAASSGCGGEGDFDVEFRFNRCEWDTGGASGGTGGFDNTPGTTPTAAQSGFDSGNGVDFVEIMNSRITRTINRQLCEESNVGMPGIWQFQIRGGAVVCPDAGDACTVPGLSGACAMGRTNCVGATTECVQQVLPESEICDNLDNDCDGTVDDGDPSSLCGMGYVCRSGVCVESCFEGSCASGLVCIDPNICVEAGCETTTCPEGERCSGGSCVPACSGVTCPFGSECLAGRCVPSCAGITCDDCTTCDAGACVVRCDMGGTCDAGETCDPATGGCVTAGCVGVSCPTGEHCEGGTCVDSCIGVTCPAGQMCTLGACVVIEIPDAGPPVDAGVIRPDAGELPDGGMIDPGMDGGPPAQPDAGRGRPPPAANNCGCHAGGSTPSGVGFALLGLALALVRRRAR